MAVAESFETVVVGSGFGGSVMAYRLANAGKQVLLLERGQKYRFGEFARTIPGVGDSFWDPSAKLYGRYNVWFFKKLGALVASGLGGGSLIYANVLARKPKEWFDREERWPITYADLEEHYAAVENILAPRPYPREARYDVPKVAAFRRAATALAARDASLKVVDDLPLAVAFSSPGQELGSVIPGQDNMHKLPRRTCTLCGDCIAGCNLGAKSTLDLNYLSLAENHGALIRELHEVRGFRVASGAIEVDYVKHDPRAGTQEAGTLRCRRLVLAAGTFGSTYLMLNNGFKDDLPALGTRFSGNGDQLAFAHGTASNVDAMFGPSITMALRGTDTLEDANVRQRGFYLEDAGFPHELAWLAEGFRAGGWLKRGVRFVIDLARNLCTPDSDPDLGAELRSLLGNAELSSRLMPLLVMGRDYADGTFSLTPAAADKDGKRFLKLDWNGDRSTDYFRRVTEVQRMVANELGGRFVLNLPTQLLQRAVTVHPLGGCPMGSDATDSVVDSYGKVHGVEGLYIVDGSILPGSVGPNPSLTIAAVADRAASRLLAER